ncbi:MAG: CHAD domain-containing protein [Nitrososphaeraceae archaeon]
MSKFISIDNILYAIDPKAYLNKSERNIQRVNNRLDEYLKAPNEEHIHDIRTAIRRLRASYQSLPKAIRNEKKMNEFVAKSKELFSINSKIRDYDIIFGMLSKYVPVEHLPKPGQQLQFSQTSTNLFKLLKTVRNRKLSEAKSIALDLRKLNLPKLGGKMSNKSESKLEKRFNNVVCKLANTIERNYPVVLSSPKRISELHEMRKDCKQLRYLLELLPIGENGKNKDEDKVSQAIEELAKVQDMLGTIHDCDTTIAYLKNHHKDRPVHGVIEHLYKDRQKKFEQFAEYCKVDLSDSNDNLFLNIMNIS